MLQNASIIEGLLGIYCEVTAGRSPIIFKKCGIILLIRVKKESQCPNNGQEKRYKK